MIDADKCQYNGYMDFFTKEGSKVKREETSKVKSDKENAILRKNYKK